MRLFLSVWLAIVLGSSAGWPPIRCGSMRGIWASWMSSFPIATRRAWSSCSPATTASRWRSRRRPPRWPGIGIAVAPVDTPAWLQRMRRRSRRLHLSRQRPRGGQPADPGRARHAPLPVADAGRHRQRCGRGLCGTDPGARIDPGRRRQRRILDLHRHRSAALPGRAGRGGRGRVHLPSEGRPARLVAGGAHGGPARRGARLPAPGRARQRCRQPGRR